MEIVYGNVREKHKQEELNTDRRPIFEDCNKIRYLKGHKIKYFLNFSAINPIIKSDVKWFRPHLYESLEPARKKSNLSNLDRKNGAFDGRFWLTPREERQSMDIARELEKYIIDELRYSDHREESIDSAENLIANGTIDSLGILKLTGFIENSFHIQITDEDITKENFQSINSIKWFIEKKLENQ